MWVLGTIPLVLLTHPLFNYTALHPTVLESDSGVEPAIRSFYRTQIHSCTARNFEVFFETELWRFLERWWSIRSIRTLRNLFSVTYLITVSSKNSRTLTIIFFCLGRKSRGAKLRSPVNILFRPITNGNRRFFFAIYLIEVHRSTSQKKEKSKKGKIYFFTETI